MAEKSNYRLRAGFIIHNPNFHNGFVYNNDNLTDKVAAEYLEQFPGMKPYFAQLPADGGKTPSKGTTTKPKENKADGGKNTKK